MVIGYLLLELHLQRVYSRHLFSMNTVWLGVMRSDFFGYMIYHA